MSGGWAQRPPDQPPDAHPGAGEFVGLDPDATRGLATRVGTAQELVEAVRAEVPGILSVFHLDDNGSLALSAEIADELLMLRSLLDTKADAMEGADRAFGPSYDDLLAALWASLSDGVGAGFDPHEHDADDDDDAIALSSTVAARTLAEFLRERGIDAIDGLNIDELLNDPGTPPHVVAALQHFRFGGFESYIYATGAGRGMTAESLEHFADQNDALAIVARTYSQIVGLDGELSSEEIEAVLEDPHGRYTDEEAAALRYLLSTIDGSPDGLHDLWSMHTFTQALVWHGVLAGDPALAAQWVWTARADPTGTVSEYVWSDEAGARAWLAAAMASTDDRQEQLELALGFFEIYQQTKPAGALESVHQLLDLVSVIDPTFVADGLNGVIYAVEGDELSAGISAGAAALPFVSGGAVRSARSLLGFIRGGRSVDAAFINAVKRGEVSQKELDAFFDELTAVDPDLAPIVRRRIDELLARANDPHYLTQSPSSSSQLGRNLAEEQPTGFQTHHIVAGDHPLAADAYETLTRYGIDINTADNGINLPNNAAAADAARHSHPDMAARTIHPKDEAYYRWVNKKLADVTSREEALDVLDAIKQELAAGGRPWLGGGP